MGELQGAASSGPPPAAAACSDRECSVCACCASCSDPRSYWVPRPHGTWSVAPQTGPVLHVVGLSFILCLWLDPMASLDCCEWRPRPSLWLATAVAVNGCHCSQYPSKLCACNAFVPVWPQPPSACDVLHSSLGCGCVTCGRLPLQPLSCVCPSLLGRRGCLQVRQLQPLQSCMQLLGPSTQCEHQNATCRVCVRARGSVSAMVPVCSGGRGCHAGCYFVFAIPSGCHAV